MISSSKYEHASQARYDISIGMDMVTPALAPGASVALDGRVIMADGTYQALVEGQSIIVDSSGAAS